MVNPNVKSKVFNLIIIVFMIKLMLDELYAIPKFPPALGQIEQVVFKGKHVYYYLRKISRLNHKLKFSP